MKSGDTMWHYTYEQGLSEVTIDSTCRSEEGMVVITPMNNSIVVLKKELFMSREMAESYSFAINYKRGWLRREMENNPSHLYHDKLENSIERFPELWV